MRAKYEQARRTVLGSHRRSVLEAVRDKNTARELAESFCKNMLCGRVLATTWR